MNDRKTKLLFLLALAALLAIFAGCKAESPTAPPPVGSGGNGGSGNPPSGGVTPPVGAAVTLSVSNPNPLTNSITNITATVTLNGQAVVNGTAVEFTTDVGTFTDTQDDVATLAHELGHAYHSWVLKDEPLFLQDYPMNLAETASTFAETVLAEQARACGAHIDQGRSARATPAASAALVTWTRMKYSAPSGSCIAIASSRRSCSITGSPRSTR